MRPSCLDCMLKHVASAIVLSSEVPLGYPHHFVYVVGHLNQAEEEIVHDYPDIAAYIRQVRIDYMAFGKLGGDEFARKIYEFYEKNGQAVEA